MSIPPAALADIRYPTDCSLLNEAREKLEATIDDLFELSKEQMTKPRIYRKNARKDYLKLAKKKPIQFHSSGYRQATAIRETGF